jgi:hypothetical protein
VPVGTFMIPFYYRVGSAMAKVTVPTVPVPQHYLSVCLDLTKMPECRRSRCDLWSRRRRRGER